jgi:hypothetical protein
MQEGVLFYAAPPSALWVIAVLQFDKRHDLRHRLLYHGSVQNVLNGHVAPGSEIQWIEASALTCGFMAGSPRGMTSAGELVVLGGQAYAKSTDTADFRYWQVVHGSRFVSPAVAGVEAGADASWLVSGRTPRHQPKKLSDLYKEVYTHVARPFVFSALVRVDRLHGNALSLPPIYEEPIFEYKSRYWAFPPTVEEGGAAILVGLVADLTDPKQTALNRKLDVVLYANPFDRGARIAAHCHALTLRGELSSKGDLRADMVDDVLHLLSDTTLNSLQLDVYPLEDVQPLPLGRSSHGM